MRAHGFGGWTPDFPAVCVRIFPTNLNYIIQTHCTQSVASVPFVLAGNTISILNGNGVQTFRRHLEGMDVCRGYHDGIERFGIPFLAATPAPRAESHDTRAHAHALRDGAVGAVRSPDRAK